MIFSWNKLITRTSLERIYAGSVVASRKDWIKKRTPDQNRLFEWEEDEKPHAVTGKWRKEGEEDTVLMKIENVSCHQHFIYQKL